MKCYHCAQIIPSKDFKISIELSGEGSSRTRYTQGVAEMLFHIGCFEELAGREFLDPLINSYKRYAPIPPRGRNNLTGRYGDYGVRHTPLDMVQDWDKI